MIRRGKVGPASLSEATLSWRAISFRGRPTKRPAAYSNALLLVSDTVDYVKTPVPAAAGILPAQPCHNFVCKSPAAFFMQRASDCLRVGYRVVAKVLPVATHLDDIGTKLSYGGMQIFVETPICKTIMLDVTAMDTINMIKALVNPRQGAPRPPSYA